jgi:hypothetical protein
MRNPAKTYRAIYLSIGDGVIHKGILYFAAFIPAILNHRDITIRMGSQDLDQAKGEHPEFIIHDAETYAQEAAHASIFF